MEEASILTERG